METPTMTGYISKKMLGAARLPDTPSARKYLERVLDDDDTQTYKKPWVGLTDEERAEIMEIKWWDWEDSFDVEGFTRAIEAKLKEKNFD
jgi:hypothetical protein